MKKKLLARTNNSPRLKANAVDRSRQAAAPARRDNVVRAWRNAVPGSKVRVRVVARAARA